MEDIEKIPHLLLVLGMHRSGTSALTRGLQVINVELSDALIGPLPENNPKGFFEDITVNQLNDTLLAELGLRWCSQGELTALDIRIRDLSELHEKAKSYLAELLKSKNDFIAIKDPRFSILLPFWQPIFESLHVKVSYIIACRHPMSVAHSLQNRDKIEIQHGVLLWYRHMMAALRYTQNQKRLVVNYDNLIEDTKEELERISRFLGINDPVNEIELMEYESVFLEKELRHHYFENDLVGFLPELKPSVHDLQKILQKASKVPGDYESASCYPDKPLLNILKTIIAV